MFPLDKFPESPSCSSSTQLSTCPHLIQAPYHALGRQVWVWPHRLCSQDVYSSVWHVASKTSNHGKGAGVAGSLLPPHPPNSHSGALLFLEVGRGVRGNLLCSEINSPGAQSLAFGSLLTSHFSHLALHTYTFPVVPASPLLAIPICLPIWHAVDFGDSLVYCQRLSDNAMGFISLLPSLMCLQDLSSVGRGCVSVVHGGVSVPRTVPGT